MAMAGTVTATALAAGPHCGCGSLVATNSTSSVVYPPAGWTICAGRTLSSSRSLGRDELRKSGVKNSVGNGKVGATSPGISGVLAAEEALGKFNLSGLKADLLAAVAGLDRGLVATTADAELAKSLALKLEEAGDGIELPEDLDKLQGSWRLVYSSGFNTGSLGGQRPGPTITRLPLVSIGLVYQRIDVAARELDNILDLNIPTLWPVPTIQFTASLAHSFEVVDKTKIKIIFEKTTLTPKGALSSFTPVDLPQIRLPDFLRTPRGRGSGEFTTTFVDKDLRISRGDRGEIRIFVRS